MITNVRTQPQLTVKDVNIILLAKLGNSRLQKLSKPNNTQDQT